MVTKTMPFLDIPYGKRMKEEPLQELLHHVFQDILPQQGFAYRENQAELASEMLHAIAGRRTLLAEAEVGTGKTHAYLLAAILAKRGRLNDFWNSGFYPHMNYLELANLPIVISTSSIALQKAIVKDYIPELSGMLIQYGIIEKPLTSVIRKGKEHYLCEANLHSQILNEQNSEVKHKLTLLLKRSETIDLAEVTGFMPHILKKIGVPQRCGLHCAYRKECRYRLMMERASNPNIDFQITNHNYFLADSLRRAAKQSPLIPNYQVAIIDEAHKFLQAAQQMARVEFSSTHLPEIIFGLDRLHYHFNDEQAVHKLTKKLMGQNRRLFKQLSHQSTPGYTEEEKEQDKQSVVLDKELARYLHNISAISSDLRGYLEKTKLSSRDEGEKAQSISLLKQAENRAAILSKSDRLVTWLEGPAIHGNNNVLLAGVPNNINEQLHTNLWNKGLPIILTSGTLSAAGDFTRTKETLGLERVAYLNEITKASPFDYKENVLLYISENMPFPDVRSREYIDAVVAEVKALLLTSHGHGAVLFTSYRVMDLVCEQIEQSDLPYPLFRMDKGGIKVLEQFKGSGNGVLFASGALWEGIDLPGDILSMLIIVKLPFAVPGPLSVYEQSLYPNFEQYKANVVLPDMLMKLKQGFGRLIRTENDTGVVAILDSRAGESGSYRKGVLAALPQCRVTAEVQDIKYFILQRKPDGYISL